MNTKRVKWFYHRLKAMSLQEIVFRIKQKQKIKQYEKNFKSNKTVLGLPLTELKLNNLNLVNNKIDAIWTFSNIEVKYGYDFVVNIFSSDVDLNKEFSWHGFNEIKWEKDIFSWNIDFKNKDKIGEVRLTWELNRHLFLPYLLLKAKNNNDKMYYDKARALFYSWVDDNFYLRGVNWSSPMEIAIRAYQWLICYAIIKDNDDKKFKKDLIIATINSMKYVSENLSGFSSANNHLILEAGLISIVGEVLQDIFEQDWFKKGYTILNHEFKRQFYRDGVNKEHAAHYHGFVVDLWLQYNTFLKSLNKKPLLENLLLKAVEFIGYIKYSDEYIEFGDSDDARIINVTGKKYSYYDYLLNFGSIYFRTSMVDSVGKTINDEVALWKYLNVTNKLKSFEYSKIKMYEEAGYFVYRSEQVHLFFDIADLGFGSIAAHGHADCLAFVLSIDNEPIFIDSGTYIYNIEKEYRDYFRSTEAHNTLSYDGVSQSIMEGPFLWSKKAKVIEKGFYEDKDYFVIYGSHDGYQPLIHRRTIYISKMHNLIIIKDEFNGDGKINFILDSCCKFDKINSKEYSINNKLYFYSNREIFTSSRFVSKNFLQKEKTNSFYLNTSKNDPTISIITNNDKITIAERTVLSGKDVVFKY
ncbi:heparinase II/III family protein [Clostridium swellfunianum]|uniref:heparinase II/III family protein n=1 Tax=Clostridium swellfunianum TaxID=1367462 RepID=UPI00203065D7|nr:alginate lyase family protein [Clostridium swellfunianum]